MLKKSSVGLAVILLVVTSVSVHAAKDFSDKSLHGGYVLRVRGFDENESASPFHSGEIAALGLIHFDGKGGVSGSVNLTTADNGGGVTVGDQAECLAAIDSAHSSYAVNSNGTGTLSLQFTSASNCVLSGAAGGSLNFNLVIDSEDTKNVSLLLSSFSSNLSIAGEPIDTLVLDGSAAKRAQ